MIFENLANFLTDAVGNNLRNNPGDVRRTKGYLNRLGFFDDEIENDFITRELDIGIRNFQRQNNLYEDGRLLPGGETERAIISKMPMPEWGKKPAYTTLPLREWDSKSTYTTLPMPEKIREPITPNGYIHSASRDLSGSSGTGRKTMPTSEMDMVAGFAVNVSKVLQAFRSKSTASKINAAHSLISSVLPVDLGPLGTVLSGAGSILGAKEVFEDKDSNALDKVNALVPAVISGVPLLGLGASIVSSAVDAVGDIAGGVVDGVGNAFDRVFNGDDEPAQTGVSAGEQPRSPLNKKAILDQLKNKQDTEGQSSGATKTPPLPTRKPAVNVDARKSAILQNGEADFTVVSNPRADGSKPWYAVNSFSEVKQNEKTIVSEAKKAGVNPDLVKAIVHLETTQGAYDRIVPFGLNQTIRPMNVNAKYWNDLGYSREDLEDPTLNIRAGVDLLKRIQSQMPKAGVAEVATVYNSLGARQISDYGARIALLLTEKPWNK